MSGDGSVTDACEPLVGFTPGKVALADRGECSFWVKSLHAELAGATAVLIADHTDGCPPSGMTGFDPGFSIPSARITKADGDLLKANLPANVTLDVDATRLAGADSAGRVLMYTPDPNEPGSSVSHWDTIATPDLLMEPFANDGEAPAFDLDLSDEQMVDVGWTLNPDSLVINGCDTGVVGNAYATAYVPICAASAAGNPGAFKSCIAHMANELRGRGLLTQKASSRVKTCAAVTTP